MISYIEDVIEPLIPGMIIPDMIKYRYTLPVDKEVNLRNTSYNFGYTGFSECVYYRTYSRVKENGKKENFHDTVIRVVNGVISIRKDWYIKHGLEWNETYWDDIAFKMGKAILKMRLLPPGRGLWAVGSEFGYTRGAAAFNNCGFCSLNEGLTNAATWTFNSLMCGCGIGFDTKNNDEFNNIFLPGCELCRHNISNSCSCNKIVYKIHDSKEGWTKSLYLLFESFFSDKNTNKESINFDYSGIREAGEKIKGFGGVSSGYKPLETLHKHIKLFFECYIDSKINVKIATLKMLDGLIDSYPISNKYERVSLIDAKNKIENMSPCEKTYGNSRLICDIFNAIGVCVVAGNVRRGSEISLGKAGDQEFLNLKNYELNPERITLGWMSNNSVVFEKTEDFDCISDISERIKKNGEPGIFNQLNVNRYGRYGKREPIGRESEKDKAIGVNPCLTGDTLIDTDKGKKKITELIGKQFNAIVDGKIYPSTEQGFWSSGIKSVWKITLENGMNIRATSNHKFLFHDNNISSWKCVDDNIIRFQMVTSLGLSIVKRVIYDEMIGEEEVYDCTIPNKNCFYANGMLSHNCSEIPLESYEYCNLAELFPSRCENFDELIEAAELAAIYTSSISLLPTHWVKSNQIIAKNRRTGISISGIVEEYHKIGFSNMTKNFRFLYRKIRETNKRLAEEAGVVESIRVTCVKPSGTISQLVGVPCGIHFNTFQYCIRRIRIASNSDIVPILQKANYHNEYDVVAGEGTLVFSFPLFQGNSRTAENVSVWEQANLQAALQREWSDNCVSCTLYFNPETESNDIEFLISQNIPVLKSLCVLPHVPMGVYAQTPYEKITKEEYETMTNNVGKIEWNNFSEAPEIPKGCDGDSCSLTEYLKNSKKLDK